MSNQINPLTGEKVSDEAISSLSELCEKKAKLLEYIAEAEEALKALKKQHAYVDEVQIPEKMQDLGVESITLNDGKKVAVTNVYAGSVRKDSAMEAFMWLEQNGHGGIVKSEVKVNFGKGERENAVELVTNMREDYGVLAEFKQSVHPMTMKSFVREQHEKGEDLPDTLFSTHIGKKTTLK